MPPNTLKEGSRWTSPHGDVDVKKYIHGAVGHSTEYKNKFHAIRSDDHTLTIACINVPVHANAKRREATCSFVVHCSYKKEELALKVKKCCLNHSCLGVTSNSTETTDMKERKRNQSLSVILCGKEEVYNDYSFGGTKTHGQAIALRETVCNVSNVTLSKRVAQRAVQQKNGQTFRQAVEELLILEEVLKSCRASDPQGVYFVEYSELSYKPPFAFGKCQKGFQYRMFNRLHVIPSAAMKFWKSSRKIVAADAAHLHGQFQGVVNMLTVKDANEHNLTLMFSICNQENNENWYATAFLAAQYLFDFDVDVFISDRCKGLERIPMDLGNMYERCNFVSCALHIAANAGIQSADGKMWVTKMAKAPTEDDFQKYCAKLAMITSQDKIDKLLLHKNKFALCMFLKNRDFSTNYGQVNTNAAEQQNFVFKDMRGMSLVSALLYFLNEINSKFSTRLSEGLSMKDKKMDVTENIVNMVKTSGQRTFKEKKWRISLQPILMSTEKPDEIEEATFLLKSQQSFSETYTQFSVSFFPRRYNWKERIECSRCSYFIALGMPCFHSAFILLSLVNTRRASSDKQLRLLAGSPIWSPWCKLWYSPIYHVDNFIEQYSHNSFCRPTVLKSMKKTLIFPPAIKPKTGRPKVKRIDKRSMKRKREETDVEEYPEIEDLFANNEEIEGFLIEVVPPVDPYDSIAPSRPAKCSKCGKPSHNAQTCSHANTSYMLSTNKRLVREMEKLTFTDNEVSTSVLFDADKTRAKQDTTLFELFNNHNSKFTQYLRRVRTKYTENEPLESYHNEELYTPCKQCFQRVMNCLCQFRVSSE